MNDAYERLSLDNINGGAIVDLFNNAWSKVVEDIADVNKPAKAKRTLDIKIEVLPSEERGHGEILTSVGIKLPSPDPVGGLIFLQMKGGRIESYVTNPKQESLIVDEVETFGTQDDSEPNVLKMDKKRG